jgi:hypothetical protein
MSALSRVHEMRGLSSDSWPASSEAAVLIMAALYPACRWFANVKRRRRDWWLSYL